MQVAKWGNSLAIRLPTVVVEALQLKEGDEVEVRIADARELEVSRKPDRLRSIERLRGFRGRLPADWNSIGKRRVPDSFFDSDIESAERRP